MSLNLSNQEAAAVAVVDEGIPILLKRYPTASLHLRHLHITMIYAKINREMS